MELITKYEKDNLQDNNPLHLHSNGELLIFYYSFIDFLFIIINPIIDTFCDALIGTAYFLPLAIFIIFLLTCIIF
ncbi:MAG: hypothetical protein IPF72_14770 [Chitinophagaceae bacterium]|nr:hypothetical protein [Chitinophagaceae bacterium]